ncbi:protein FRA10AC1 [Oryza brachyantha]|uniref:Protein FRA10AC1 n=1 Tax=Oryza brachyantha TaxID=4533 RepID=J3N9T0_ORYBR|nr:protein FRA10AC1 [Oryza brachyantha]
MASSLGRLKSSIFDKEERKMQYQSHIRGLNAYDRHKKFMKDYVQFYGHGKDADNSVPIKTDKDTLREGYRFIFSEEDDMDSTWEKRLVKRYYDKLFKEYCIADMSQYKKGKIGLRWRTEKEVISGKGQFICGNRICDEKNGLGSYEVNFSYIEAGEQKQALVKLVACKRCAEKLAYKRQKEKEKELSGEKEMELKQRDKRKRDHEGSEETEDASEDESTEKYTRRTKDRKRSSTRKMSNTDEGFEEFLEGMFP